ncbi:hypothetical protein ACJ41O_013844 [Fusarium nematophilum]
MAHGADEPPRACRDRCDKRLQDLQLPELRFEIRDLNHCGTQHFLNMFNVADCMTTAAKNVLQLLYVPPSLPPTRSITLVLTDMPEIARLLEGELGPDHRVIELSISYIGMLFQGATVTKAFAGLITHHMVHCVAYSWSSQISAGFIEGIADWVRIRAGLASEFWREDADGGWDDGYHYTAYFLEYVENRFGEGTIRGIIHTINNRPLDASTVWTEVTGHSVEDLWQQYGQIRMERDSRYSDAAGRGLSAYMFFSNDQRQKVIDEFPDASFGEVSSILRKRFEALDDDAREPYAAMVEADRRSYLKLRRKNDLEDLPEHNGCTNMPTRR